MKSKLVVGKLYVDRNSGRIGRCVQDPLITNHESLLMDFPDKEDYISYWGVEHKLRRPTQKELLDFLERQP